MSDKQFDRTRLRFKSLKKRKDRVFIERDHVSPSAMSRTFHPEEHAVLTHLAERMSEARKAKRPRMLVFGAHTIKNGLAPIIMKLMEDGWLTHLATNGAGIIHDWEFAFQGHSSEHVREGIERGEFGLWEETGCYLNLALAVGAYRGLGYGAAIGALIEQEGIDIPSAQHLEESARNHLTENPAHAAAAADLLDVVRTHAVEPGWLSVPHPYKHFSLQAAAYRAGIPFTAHPMIGQDIIYMHPLNRCAAIGRTAETDFLQFAEQVSHISGGVYISIGSAVMSPMVFEKSMAMAQNLAKQRRKSVHDHLICVVDLQPSTWDWSEGEPQENLPDYYVRFSKSFARMGGTLRYLKLDNRDFLLALAYTLIHQQ